MREPRRVLALAAHVVEHEHDAADVAARRGSARQRSRSRSGRRGAGAARRCPPTATVAPSRNARATGSATSTPVASSCTANTAGSGTPRASSSRHPVRRSATGFMYSTLPDVSTVITASAIDASVTCARSFCCERLRLGALAIRDVGERAGHPLRLAALAEHRAAAHAKPAIRRRRACAAGTRGRTARRCARCSLEQRERRAPLGVMHATQERCRPSRAACRAR